MKDEIEKLVTLSDMFSNYDKSIFQRLPNGNSITLNAIESVQRTEKGYTWYRRLSPDRYAIVDFSGGSCDSIRIVSSWNYEEIYFQLYIGSEKYLIDQFWFDRLDFEAQAFQIDTTTRFEFSLMSVHQILTSFGVS